MDPKNLEKREETMRKLFAEAYKQRNLSGKKGNIWRSTRRAATTAYYSICALQDSINSKVKHPEKINKVIKDLLSKAEACSKIAEDSAKMARNALFEMNEEKAKTAEKTSRQATIETLCWTGGIDNIEEGTKHVKDARAKAMQRVQEMKNLPPWQWMRLLNGKKCCG